MLTSCSFEDDEQCSSSFLLQFWYPVAWNLPLSLTGLCPHLWPIRHMWALLVSPASDIPRFRQSRDICIKPVHNLAPQS